MEETLEPIYTMVASGFELLGVIAMVVGIFIAAVLSVRTLNRHEGGEAAYKTLRVTVGGAILLGLEILVAADLVRTITSNPSIEEAVVLGLVVIIRTILSMSISIEIEGVLPWKRALLQSGGSVIAQQIQADQIKSKQHRYESASQS